MKKSVRIQKALALALLGGLLSGCSFSFRSFSSSNSFSSGSDVSSTLASDSASSSSSSRGSSASSLTPSSSNSSSYGASSSAGSSSSSPSLSSSSSSSSSAGSSSSESISSSSSASSSISILSSYDFRIKGAYEATGATGTIYAVGKVGDSYVGSPVKSLKRGQDCLIYEEVAEYYSLFRDIPGNYFASEEEALAYGKNGRLVNTYYSGSRHSYDYTVKLGTFNQPSGGAYYEFDIDLTGRYNTGSYINRGAGRVVTVVEGITDYGSEPVSYYTEDHYADFKEFYNFYQGWSPLFAGVYNKSGSYENSPTSTLSRPQVPTVSYTLL